MIAIKFTLFFLTICLLSSTLFADEIPVYNSEKYCKSIADYSGGGYWIESSCREEEEKAKNRISKRDINALILKYCSKISALSNESYTIFESCVLMEEEAKIRISKMNIDANTMNYCTDLTSIIGGSFTTFEICVKSKK